MRQPATLAALLALLVAATPAAARMYQWLDPHTGRVQLSGAPPAWYRGGTAGPRVLVFDDGELVDDTAIGVSEAQRERLPEASLVMAERMMNDARLQVREPSLLML